MVVSFQTYFMQIKLVGGMLLDAQTLVVRLNTLVSSDVYSSIILEK